MISTFPKGSNLTILGRSNLFEVALSGHVCVYSLFNPRVLPRVNPNLRRQRVAEEANRARRPAVGAGLKDCNKVADFRMWEDDPARESIERRAKRADDIHGFARWRSQLIHQSYGVIPFDGLAQISGSRLMMVHSAIDNEELLAA